MAQVLSYVIFVFTLTPIFAPAMGYGIALLLGWRGIFASFAVFTIISMAWLLIRLPETLAPENTRPFKPRKLFEGTQEILGNRRVVLATLVQTLIFGSLFATLASSQQVFGEVFDREASFPFWFGFMAILAELFAIVCS